MAMEDFYTNFALLMRWLHVIAGILWIGLLYFFNFVNVPLQATLDDAAKKAVNPQLMPRALFWFRWAAMATFLAGLVLFLTTYFYTPGVGFGANGNMKAAAGGLTGRATWIMLGMFLGSVMWFNVWFIIWPAQQKLLSGKAGDAAAALRKRALLASRTNAYLSGPMLFGMLAPAHYGAFSVVSFLIAAALSCFAIWWVIRTSHTVSTKV